MQHAAHAQPDAAGRQPLQVDAAQMFQPSQVQPWAGCGPSRADAAQGQGLQGVEQWQCPGEDPEVGPCLAHHEVLQA